MKLHEYQSKALFSDYAIPVPPGQVVTTAAEARAAATTLGGQRWVVKAQVHSGGRGKAGGIRIVDDLQGVAQAAGELLGSRLITRQSGAAGQPVDRLLIEQPCDIDRELYLACLVDRARARIVFIASTQGGMDIEEVAARTPDQILTTPVHPAAGLGAYHCRELGFALDLRGAALQSFCAIVRSLYRLFAARDLSLVEINPLVVTGEGALLALDAKITVDDNALFRHIDLAALRDAGQENARENRAREHELSYVALDGNIGCMVNGAGLAMATMDLVKLHGGEPANFLDVGGGTTAERVAEAFKLILDDQKVRAILVNIFGGIVRCDLIAQGVIRAVREVGIEIPVVVRLEGTNVEQGRQLLADSALAITAATGLDDAAEKVVAAAKANLAGA